MFTKSKKRSSAKKASQSIEKRISLEFGEIVDKNGTRNYELKKEVKLDFSNARKVIEEMLKWEKQISTVPFKGKLRLNQGGLIALGEAFKEFTGHTNLKELSIAFDASVNTGSITKSAEFLKYAYFLQSLHIDFTGLDPELEAAAFNIYVHALTNPEVTNLEVLHFEGPRDLTSYLLGISLVTDDKVKHLIFSGTKPAALESIKGITFIAGEHQTIIRKAPEKRSTKSISFSNPINTLKDK